MTDERRTEIYTLCWELFSVKWRPLHGSCQMLTLVDNEVTVDDLSKLQLGIQRPVTVSSMLYIGGATSLELEWEEA